MSATPGNENVIAENSQLEMSLVKLSPNFSSAVRLDAITALKASAENPLVADAMLSLVKNNSSAKPNTQSYALKKIALETLVEGAQKSEEARLKLLDYIKIDNHTSNPIAENPEIQKWLYEIAKNPEANLDHRQQAIDGLLPFIDNSDVLYVADFLLTDDNTDLQELLIKSLQSLDPLDPNTAKTLMKIKIKAKAPTVKAAAMQDLLIINMMGLEIKVY